jgi:hypothetical protein
MHSLGDNEPKVVFEPVGEPLSPMRGSVATTEGGLHPDLAIAQFDREDRRVVRPQIKGATAFKIEPGVVPMTGQDAVFDAASLKRETHVRATIVKGEDMPAIVDNKNRTMTAVQHEPALRLQFLKAACEREFPARYVHQLTSGVLERNISILSRKRQEDSNAGPG